MSADQFPAAPDVVSLIRFVRAELERMRSKTEPDALYASEVQPEIWARLHTSYDTAAVYPGSVGDGAIVVMVSRSPPPAT